MGFVVSGIDDWLAVCARQFIKLSAHQPLQKQFFLDPDWDCATKTSKSSWSKRQISLQKAFEFEQRFFVVYDVVDIGQSAPTLFQR